MKKNFKWTVAQNLELKWWKNYLKNKNVGDYLAWKKNYWLQFLKDIEIDCNDLANKTILDAGCGPAGIFSVLNDSEVVAIDPLLDNYTTLEHFDKNWYSHVDFVTTTIEEYRTNKKFDYVFCLNAINHVADIEKAYSVLVDQLNDNGILIISTDAHQHHFLKRIFKAIPGDALHPHQYNKKEYEQFLLDRNCSILKSYSFPANFIFDYIVWKARK
ncbi:MAG: methyltransferase domain-containing protein [Chitinophagales bacterium]|nr:methyltransferase domain-containing protein [Chitinophagales bacterium]